MHGVGLLTGVDCLALVIIMIPVDPDGYLVAITSVINYISVM